MYTPLYKEWELCHAQWPIIQFMDRMKFCLLILIATCVLVVISAVRRHLDQNEVARAVQQLKDGVHIRVVADRLGVSPSVVSRLQTWYQETGQYTMR